MPDNKSLPNSIVRIDGVATKFRELIAQEQDRLSKPIRIGTFAPEEITQCPRRLFYRLIYTDPDPNSHPVDYLNDLNKDATCKKWLSVFKKCKKTEVVSYKTVVGDGDYNLWGHIDIVIRCGGRLFCVKVKSVNNHELQNIKEKGALRKHVVELVTYLWLLEKKDGLLIYESVNPVDYQIYHVKYSSSVIRSIKQKCSELLDSKLKGTIPTKPYKNSADKECSGCEYKVNCWEKEN